MQITIDLMQALLALLILVGVVLGVFLVILLARLIGALKKVSQLVTDIQGPITQTVDQLPGLIKKVDGVTQDVSVMTESAQESVPAILKDAQTITGTARAGVEAIGGAAKSVGEGVSSFFHPEPAAPAGNLGTILDIISQIMTVVGFFTSRSKNKSKTGSRGKRRR